MDAITLGHAQRAFFQLQNRVAVVMNEQVRPGRAKRISLAANFKETEIPTYHLVKTVVFHLDALIRSGDTKGEFPNLCLGRDDSDYAKVRDFSDQYLYQWVALLKRDSIDAECWHARIRKPIEAHVADCESWFADLQRGDTSGAPVGTNGQHGESQRPCLARDTELFEIHELFKKSRTHWADTRNEWNRRNPDMLFAPGRATRDVIRQAVEKVKKERSGKKK